MTMSSSCSAGNSMRPLHGVLPRDDPLVGHADPDRALVLVGLALGDEPLGLGAAALRAVELEACRSVPLDPEPPERPLDLLRRLRHLARRVRVLDPQQALAAAAAREQPVEEERADAADVEEPRGRGAMRTRTLIGGDRRGWLSLRPRAPR